MRTINEIAVSLETAGDDTDEIRVLVGEAQAIAASADASYQAYCQADGGDYDGEHVVDWSVAADKLVERAEAALAEALIESIDVGSVDEVYPRYEDGEEVDLADMTGDLAYCVHLDVVINGKSYSVACSVGIQPRLQGSARASGALTSYGGGPDVWWEDSTDWDQLPDGLADAVLSALGNVAGRLLREAEEICEEALEAEQTKDKVGRGWETVASYVATYPDDSLTGEGATDVEVQIGEARGVWYLRTQDDAGGSDECDDTRYDSEAEAREAAEEFASDNDEADDGEDAEAYCRRKLEERAGEPSEDGEWCVYWETSGDDGHVVDRFDTREQAEAAAELADEALHKRHQGQLLCGYVVRQLVDGEWVGVGSEEDAA